MKTRCIILCDVDGSNDDDEVNDDGDDENDEDKDDDAGGGDGGDGRSAGCWVLACWLFSLPFSLSLSKLPLLGSWWCSPISIPSMIWLGLREIQKSN